jgi:phosphoglycolate phosphatase-like HAD superfamily hydrolase
MLKNSKVIFWDFDGVIKDSVEVKSIAYEQLFLQFGEGIAKRVREHHEEYGGMSRFDKLPIYLDWALHEVTLELTTEYLENFSRLVKQKVINSKWVAGVLTYLKNNYDIQQFFLVTATPQQEIEEILSAIKIKHFFKEVVGSPIKKSVAIKRLLDRYKININQSIMIGDSISDYNAATTNNITFYLRKTELNKNMQQQLNCKMIDNFL